MAGMSDLRRRTHQPIGGSSESTEDETAYYPPDDNHGFFAKGRDFESAFVNHRYTSEERRTLSSYESLDYLPPHSQVYRNWIRQQPQRLDWDRWIMMGMIGFTVGFIGFLLHQITEVIADFKWEQAQRYIEDSDLLSAWGFVLGYSVLFVLIATIPVVFFRPSAAGSGIPEVIGFLNGTIVHNIFNVKTMVVKFFSCCAAVGSGMPVGPEGPMIHLGSLVGAGLSQFRSQTLRIKLPFFERFRNSEDRWVDGFSYVYLPPPRRRNFISAGAAAGVASAFGAPVGGLLFSMEEVSSFWNMKLSWQIFFCAMISTFTTDLFNSAFTGFRYQGQFGMFKADKYILFQVSTGISVNILAFIPAVLLGVVGGILGALFTFTNLKIARARKRLLSKIANSVRRSLVKLTEPVVIMVLVASVSVFLPAAFPCHTVYCLSGPDGTLVPQCYNDTEYPLQTEATVEMYTCPEGSFIQNGTRTLTNLTYNEMATLMFDTGEDAIHHLFSRNTHLEFGYVSLLTALVFYFVMACWAAGTAISSGIVVPMLFIGGLYGRMLGRGMVDLFGVHVGPESYWSWMDPGAFALVGAASFFGGVSRLTMSLTVIMIEITNDVQFLLPIMATIMVAKWVGDFLTHPLYHALLELKCIPFLDAEPVITNEAKEMVNLELFQASHVMSSTLHTCQVHETVHNLAELVCTHSHGGFPVLKHSQDGSKVFFGFISRQELLVLLPNEDMFQPAEDLGYDSSDVTHVDFHRVSIDSPPHSVEMIAALNSYIEDPKYQQLYINLEPYVNQSAVSIPAKFSLHRTYIIFRTLGLRHLTVVDDTNCAVGVITRKDLMGFSMEEKLGSKLRAKSVGTSTQSVELENVNAVI